MIAKALTLPADGLILDLEDAVPPELKPTTRPIVRRWLETLDFGGRERWVRMNPIFTEHAVPDIEETIAARPDGYVVPKPRSAEDVRRVTAQRECRDGVAMGFSGKISIHPSQIEVINQEFTPSKAEGEDALALIAAFEEHAKKGAGAFTWKGQMMDQPHLTRAKKIADRARRAGVI